MLSTEGLKSRGSKFSNGEKSFSELDEMQQERQPGNFKKFSFRLCSNMSALSDGLPFSDEEEIDKVESIIHSNLNMSSSLDIPFAIVQDSQNENIALKSLDANQAIKRSVTPTFHIKEEPMSDTQEVTPIKSFIVEDDPVTPTANLKLLLYAASPEIRNRERQKHDDYDVDVGVDELSFQSTENSIPSQSDIESMCERIPRPVKLKGTYKTKPKTLLIDTVNIEPEPVISRKDKSLGLLCQRFTDLFEEYPDQYETTHICLDAVASELGVERRRIYDIINVLESVRMVSRVAKNKYAWHGKRNLTSVLSRLKTDDFHDGSNNRTAYEDFRQCEMLEVSRKDRSLGILSQRFLRLFLLQEKPRIVNLDYAASQLLNETPYEKRATDKIKTKVRRLYDIANVLSSLKLIQKVQLKDSRRLKPAFEYIGPDPDEFEDCPAMSDPAPLVHKVKRPTTKRPWKRNASLEQICQVAACERERLQHSTTSEMKEEADGQAPLCVSPDSILPTHTPGPIKQPRLCATSTYPADRPIHSTPIMPSNRQESSLRSSGSFPAHIIKIERGSNVVYVQQSPKITDTSIVAPEKVSNTAHVRDFTTPKQEFIIRSALRESQVLNLSKSNSGLSCNSCPQDVKQSVVNKRSINLPEKQETSVTLSSAEIDQLLQQWESAKSDEVQVESVVNCGGVKKPIKISCTVLKALINSRTPSGSNSVSKENSKMSLEDTSQVVKKVRIVTRTVPKSSLNNLHKSVVIQQNAFQNEQYTPQRATQKDSKSIASDSEIGCVTSGGNDQVAVSSSDVSPIRPLSLGDIYLHMPREPSLELGIPSPLPGSQGNSGLNSGLNTPTLPQTTLNEESCETSCDKNQKNDVFLFPALPIYTSVDGCLPSTPTYSISAKDSPKTIYQSISEHTPNVVRNHNDDSGFVDGSSPAEYMSGSFQVIIPKTEAPIVTNVQATSQSVPQTSSSRITTQRLINAGFLTPKNRNEGLITPKRGLYMLCSSPTISPIAPFTASTPTSSVVLSNGLLCTPTETTQQDCCLFWKTPTGLTPVTLRPTCGIAPSSSRIANLKALFAAPKSLQTSPSAGSSIDQLHSADISPPSPDFTQQSGSDNYNKSPLNLDNVEANAF